MRLPARFLLGAFLVGFGYLLGSHRLFDVGFAADTAAQKGAAGDTTAAPKGAVRETDASKTSADPASKQQLPAAVRERIREANRVTVETMQALQDEGLYVPVIQGINSFAVSVGGVNAQADLESGEGVDPETFAALYAGFGTAEVNEHLGRDDQDRLTYRNKVVRIYKVSRLKQLLKARNDLVPAASLTPAKSREAKNSPDK